MRMNDERKNVKFLLLGLNALTLSNRIYEGLCKYVENYDYEGALDYAQKEIKTYNTLTAVNYLLMASAVIRNATSKATQSPNHF